MGGLKNRKRYGVLRGCRQWGNRIDGGAAFAAWIGGFLGSEDLVLWLLVCAGVADLGWLVSLSFRQRQPIPLLVFSVVLVVGDLGDLRRRLVAGARSTLILAPALGAAGLHAHRLARHLRIVRWIGHVAEPMIALVALVPLQQHRQVV